MKILYIDDYEPMGEMVRDLLEADDIEVALAGDFAQALAACTGAHGFDAVVTDYNLPGIDGAELIRAITAMGLPVIAVSGNVSPAMRDAAAGAGARALLDKKDLVRLLPGLLEGLGR